MNKTNLAWIVAALVLGAGGIYAVFSMDDSIAQANTRNVVAVQDGSSFSSSPMVPGSAASSISSPALSRKAQEDVNINSFINPFGK